MERSLLIISCSKCKIKTSGVIPAYKRYHGSKTGGIYPKLHKAIKDGYFPKNLDILIISAKYGLLRWDEPIEWYNQKMDEKRVNELRPGIQKKLKVFLNGKYYDQIFNCLWDLYNKTLEGFDLKRYCGEEIEVERNWLKKMSQMTEWIKELSDKEKGR